MSDHAGFDLSVQMEQLWLLEPDGPSLKSQIVVEVGPEPGGHQLQGLLRDAVARHEILRTHFERVPGLRAPMQVIDDDGAADWRTVELTETSAPELEARIGGLAASELEREIDLLSPSATLHGLLVSLDTDRRVLVLTAPAVIADARSLELLAGEILSSSPDGDREPLQYVDYAAWQREQIKPAAPAGPAHGDALRSSGLPWARSRTEAWRHMVPQSLPVPISDDAWNKVSHEAERRGSRPADSLLTAWTALLSRLTGEPELTVAVEDPGRPSEELQTAVGPFARSISTPINIPQELAWQEAATRVARARSDAERRAVTGRVRPGPPPALAFSYHEHAGEPAGLRRAEGHPDGFEIKLACRSRAGRLQAEISFDPDALTAHEAARIAGQLTMLIESIAADPGSEIGLLGALDEVDRRLLIEDLNATASAPPRAAGVHELVEHQARATPDAPALVAANGAVTYAELSARANQLAHVLREHGVGPGERVALFLDRSIELIVSVLATFKAGGGYVPLHPDHPEPRLAFQLEEAAPVVILTRASMRDSVPDAGVPVLAVDPDDATLSGAPDGDLGPLATAADLAYVIYTSGSTGTPKGVAVTHGNLLNYTVAVGERLALGPEPLSFGLVTTLSTDLGNTCVFPALTSGGCLHLVPVDTVMDPQAYASYAGSHPIDVLKITPSHLTALLSADDAAVLPRHTLVLGGEAAPWRLVDDVRRLGTCRVFNHYGPTETTVGSLVFPVAEEPRAGASGTVPIGRPLANTQAYIVGPQGEPVPMGAPGELCIGGAGVAQGYWRRPEQTAERFVRMPFAETTVYRTGDRARHLPSGDIEFLGRLDGQVKIRGFRVETGEIEEVLKRHQLVREAAVVLREEGDQQRLVGYVVGPQLSDSHQSELRALASERLPDYMVPAAIAVLDALPLAANGKLDRSALPAPEQMLAERRYEPPSTDTERELAAIWAETLGLERVGVTDDFFEVGGHSLLATQVIARARSSFSVDLPLHALFTSPTVCQLAATVDEHLQRADDDRAEQLARMLAEVEDLSEEDAKRLLAQSKGGSD